MSGEGAISWRRWAIGLAIAVGLIAAVAAWAVWTKPVRQSVTAFTELLGAANRQDIDAARRLCSDRYLNTHDLQPAAEGGIVGLPRNIHKNFQAWSHDGDVWLCPTNREGPVYQFVFEQGTWKFDGPIGLLKWGHVQRFTDRPAEVDAVD